jgi:hypothetical protein
MMVKDVRVKVAGKIYPIESETILIIALAGRVGAEVSYSIRLLEPA